MTISSLTLEDSLDYLNTWRTIEKQLKEQLDENLMDSFGDLIGELTNEFDRFARKEIDEMTYRSLLNNHVSQWEKNHDNNNVVKSISYKTIEQLVECVYFTIKFFFFSIVTFDILKEAGWPQDDAIAFLKQHEQEIAQQRILYHNIVTGTLTNFFNRRMLH